MNGNCIAIITARGGSKRIPRKNIRLFYNKPIIAYSIEAALNSKLFCEVMVSTDDAEIAEIAKTYGAKVPFFRSNDNSNDFATTYDVLEEVINKYATTLNKYFEYCCCIYPCVPFINSNTILKAFNILKNFNLDSVFPAVEYSFPIQRAIKRIDEVKFEFINPEYSLTRSQDLDKSYHDAGQFYWLNTEKLIEKKSLVTDNTGCIVISELEAQDIDNENDWNLAELKFEKIKSHI